MNIEEMGQTEVLTELIGESLESFEAFISRHGPWEYGFDTVKPDEIFDKKADTLVNIWFICLVLSGRIDSPKFIY